MTLYCEDEAPALGASGNRQGALYPLLNDKHDALSRFFATAFGFARRQYDSLLQAGIAYEHDWCGVNQIAYDEKSASKITQILHGNWPIEVVTPLSADEMDATAGLAIGFSGVSYA